MSFRSLGPYNADDLNNAVNSADTTLELYEVVAKALNAVGVSQPPQVPWKELAARVAGEHPQLAEALRRAQSRWEQLQADRDHGPDVV
ncbi:MAG: hypothetical protein R3310_17600 [Candidatus Competibacteraceae bacterium]|nr:hypothetical protein [Candidatus Competibacteraceae bacterium]